MQDVIWVSTSRPAGWTRRLHWFTAHSWFQLSLHHVLTLSRVHRWSACIWKHVCPNWDQRIPESTGSSLFIHCTHGSHSPRLKHVGGGYKFTHIVLLDTSVQLRKNNITIFEQELRCVRVFCLKSGHSTNRSKMRSRVFMSELYGLTASQRFAGQ